MKRAAFALLVSALFLSSISFADEKLTAKQAAALAWCDDACRAIAKQQADQQLAALDTLLETQDHEAFYAASDDIVKQKISLAQWKKAFKARDDVGAMQKRAHEATQGIFRKLPNAPQGNDYFIVTYDTFFTKAEGLYSEQITLIKRADNDYKLIGYYIAPKPVF